MLPSQPVEKQMQSIAHGPGRRAAQLSDTLHKLCLIDGEDLRCIHYAGLLKVGFALLQKDVAWRIRHAQIRRNQAHHARRNGTPVENVVLNDDARVPFRRRRTGRRSEIKRVHLPLPDLVHQRSFTVGRTLALIRFSRRFSAGCTPFA